MIKVAVVPERYGGVLSPCGTIRLSAFFDAIRAHGVGLEIRYLLAAELEHYRPDVIVWQRVALTEVKQVEALAALAARLGARLVYDLDDNLVDVAEHGEADAYRSMVAVVEASLAAADEVWVSTNELARRVAGIVRGSVHVMPNALDPGIWRAPVSAPRSPVAPFQLLYMGTRTHDEDFRMLAEGLDLLDERLPGSFELTMIGVRAQDDASIRWLKLLEPPLHVGASYPAFVHWFSGLSGFDLGLAPLMAGRFNDCKSSIKVLDYAALGLPAIASDVEAYRDTALVEGKSVLRVENSPLAWADRINSLMNHPEALASVREGSRVLVGAERFEDAVALRRDRLLKQYNTRSGLIDDGQLHQ
ncbi:glycosyltransferase [Pseudoxanthomonas sp. LARHCG66]